jgi:hypothetical protein
MNILSAVKQTFKNIDKLSVAFLYIGLEFAVGLLAVAIILTLLEGRYGNFYTMISYAKGAQDAALSCAILSVFAAFLCDAAAKDRQKKS